MNPLWLALAAAIAIPLIIHLLQRHQGPRIIFPAMRYLQRAEREHARQIKLRQLLLLLLRIAIISFISFVAARPYLRGRGIGHEPTAVVIVLDNSMSSGLVIGDRRVLDELKDRALETLNRAGPDDRFWLLRAGAPWEPALPGDATATARRVRESEPTAAAADVVAAVARAQSILGQGAQSRATEIEVLSDLQASNVRHTLTLTPTLTPTLLLWSPRRKDQPNASVENVTVGGGIAPRANERASVIADIGGNATDSVNVRLTIDRRIIGAAVAHPGSAAVIALPPRPASLINGEVQIDADALRADDRRYFVATITPPSRVLLTKPAQFVSEALDVLASAGRITKTASDAEIVVAPGAFGADAAGAKGSVVVIAPETALELPAVNRRLAELGINWRYQPFEHGELTFANAGAGDELMRSLADVRVMQSYRLEQTGRSPTDSVMLRLSDGSAWCVRGARAHGGRFVLMASPITINATTLPASRAMIPLFDRATGSWLPADVSNPVAQPAERVALPPTADQIIDPDGNRVSATGSFDDAVQPGVYRVVSKGKVIGAFVVNPAHGESELTYADAKDVARALEPLQVKRVTNPAAWQRSVFAHRVGREIWRPVLIALLLLLIVEGIVAATGSTRARAPRPATAPESVPAPAPAPAPEK